MITLGIENPNDWSGIYFNGVPITITAEPNEGYSFIGWGDNIFDSSTTIEINLTEDTTLEPIFIKDDN
ncbi:InlB B-repeat-containing protein [Evansella tamaricis]|uniref:Bacterial repeat domain-containing protein n=1 Tax=Evansella tamaricis TaxID=2069301 RepID=A0ABS6JIK1_9BACI|nr:hypothetical protein [Evansella tamaricis]